jgi:hypothetical protein
MATRITLDIDTGKQKNTGYRYWQWAVVSKILLKLIALLYFRHF